MSGISNTGTTSAKALFEHSFQKDAIHLPASYGCSAYKAITSLVLDVADRISPGYKANFVFTKVLKEAEKTTNPTKKTEINDFLEHKFTIYKIGMVKNETNPIRAEKITNFALNAIEIISTNGTIPKILASSNASDNTKELYATFNRLNIDKFSIHHLLSSYDDVASFKDLVNKLSTLSPDKLHLIKNAIPDLVKSQPEHFKLCLDNLVDHTGTLQDLQALIQNIKDPYLPVTLAFLTRVPSEDALDKKTFTDKANATTENQKKAIKLVLSELSTSSPKEFKAHLSHLIDTTKNIPDSINTKAELQKHLVKTHLHMMNPTSQKNQSFTDFFTNFTFLTTTESGHSTVQRHTKLQNFPIRHDILNLFLQVSQNPKIPDQDKETAWMSIKSLASSIKEKTPNQDIKELLWKASFGQEAEPPKGLSDKNFLAYFINEINDVVTVENNDELTSKNDRLLGTCLRSNITLPRALEWIKNGSSEIQLTDYVSSPKMTGLPKDLDAAKQAFTADYDRWASGYKLNLPDGSHTHNTSTVGDIYQSLEKVTTSDKQLQTALFALSSNSTLIFKEANTILDLQIIERLPFTFDVKKSNEDIEITIDLKADWKTSTPPTNESEEAIPQADCHMKMLIKPDGTHEITEFSVKKQET